MKKKKQIIKDGRFDKFYEKIENRRINKDKFSDKCPNEIMEMVRSPIPEHDNLYVKLKSYIIILRRENNLSIFKLFKHIVENNINIVLKLNSRWLISIADTYIDHGNDNEKKTALLISSIMTWEKMSHSTGKLKRLWDGLQTIHKYKGDAHSNLAKRIKKTIGKEFLYQLFLALIERGTTDSRFTLSKMKNGQNFISNIT